MKPVHHSLALLLAAGLAAPLAALPLAAFAQTITRGGSSIIRATPPAPSTRIAPAVTRTRPGAAAATRASAQRQRREHDALQRRQRSRVVAPGHEALDVHRRRVERQHAQDRFALDRFAADRRARERAVGRP